jgi:hypothetical protein
MTIRPNGGKEVNCLRTLQKGHEDLVAAFDAIMTGADPMSNEGVEA